MDASKLEALRRGLVIPAHPLALTAERRLDERRQRALTRYYLSAGAGGLAVGVHTTQFAIREKGLYRPVLELAAEEDARFEGLVLKVAGVCGPTRQAVAEASLARDLGYDAALLRLPAGDVDALLAHAKAVGDVLPLFGFYLQPSVGGQTLPYAFWRRFAEIPSVVAVKIAPFSRYATLDVLRAIADAGRRDLAIYTGNDDSIVSDLLSSYRGLRIAGGLLGHWAVWTRKAVELLAEARRGPSTELLAKGWEITDANAAFFDAANGFAGCVAGLHEVLRRQGLLEGIWCLDPAEGLSPGQREEIERVHRAYPHLNDDAFVEANRDAWLK